MYQYFSLYVIDNIPQTLILLFPSLRWILYEPSSSFPTLAGATTAGPLASPPPPAPHHDSRQFVKLATTTALLCAILAMHHHLLDTYYRAPPRICHHQTRTPQAQRVFIYLTIFLHSTNIETSTPTLHDPTPTTINTHRDVSDRDRLVLQPLTVPSTT